MYNAPDFMNSKQGKLCTVSRAKKRPFHTISTHFNTNLTPASQKKQKSRNSQIADD